MRKEQIKKYTEIARQTYQKEMIERTVNWFAEQMKSALNKHLDRPGWKKEGVFWLLGRLNEEIAELFKAIEFKETKVKVIKECADVANFAMMIADVYESGHVEEKERDDE